MELIVLLFVLFFIKHFVCDFPLQAFPFMYRNKGTYGHIGGIVHAGIHAVGTFAVLVWFFGPMAALVGSMIDMAVHYHIDWAKMRLNARTGWKADTSEWFWISLGVDQLLHYLTYAGIIFILL